MADQRNVQVVQGIYRDFGQGNIPGVLNAMSPNIKHEFHGPKEIPFAGAYSGRDAMAGFFKAVADHVEILEFGPTGAFLAADDHVVVLGRERVRAKHTGRVWETDWVHVWRLRGGQVVTLDEFYDTAAIVAAFRGS